ncbi:hypothetical protein [Geoglobus ahangari]
MEFRVFREHFEFFNPVTKKNERVEIEVREDPLTGKTSRVIVKPLPLSKEPELPDFSREWCPFCDDNVYRVGARDLAIAGGELLERGEAILMANISPYAETSLVIRLSKAHYIPIDQFTPEMFYDAFTLARDYLARKGCEFASVTMNYLKPAGSSVTHPHVQVLSSQRLMDYQERMVASAERYWRERGRSFWDDFWESAEELRVAERSWRWFVPFAPRGFEHVSAYLHAGFEEMDGELMELAEGVVRVLRFYHSLGFNSFNFGMFAPMEGRNDLPAVFDVVARSVMDRYYWNDVFAITKLYDEAYTNRKPEETAKEIKEFFNA